MKLDRINTAGKWAIFNFKDFVRVNIIGKIYELSAIITRTAGGPNAETHCVAFVFNSKEKKWFEYDDEMVTECTVNAKRRRSSQPAHEASALTNILIPDPPFKAIQHAYILVYDILRSADEENIISLSE